MTDSEQKIPFQDIIGIKAALLLIADFGGCEVNVPKNPSCKHRLVQSIGLDAATALRDEISHGVLRIPLHHHSSYAGFITQRAKAIDKLIAEGFNNSQIVRKIKCSERTVARRRKKDCPPPPFFKYFK